MTSDLPPRPEVSVIILLSNRVGGGRSFCARATFTFVWPVL